MSKSKTKRCWSESCGTYGCKVRVAEREPGGVLYLLWIDNTGTQRKRSLGHRDRKRGKQQAMEIAGRLASGEGVRPRTANLTLRQGVEEALDPRSGMYPVETDHVRQTRRLLERALEILGERLTWQELTPGRVQILVRRLAAKSRDGRGARSAIYMCEMLYTVANWLREEQKIPDAVALPKRKWKERLRREWEEITGRRVEVKRPRHSPEEVRRVFAALPEGDPRIHLLVELSAELRVGQAVRARRSDLDLGPVGAFGSGRFVVHGRGKKRGEIVDLFPELRALVDTMLNSGYLADAEAAYQRGDIEDYFLFPAGRLRRGRATVARCCGQHMVKTTLRDLFHKVEERAGVEWVPGRAFYGLRRQATDLAPEFEQDARVLNRLSGHVDSKTRERVYQDRESEALVARAAEARRRMREALREEKRPDLRVVA
jgi:integrase